MRTVHAMEAELSSTYDIRSLGWREHNDGIGIPRRAKVVGGPGYLGTAVR